MSDLTFSSGLSIEPPRQRGRDEQHLAKVRQLDVCGEGAPGHVRGSDSALVEDFNNVVPPAGSQRGAAVTVGMRHRVAQHVLLVRRDQRGAGQQGREPERAVTRRDLPAKQSARGRAGVAPG